MSSTKLRRGARDVVLVTFFSLFLVACDSKEESKQSNATYLSNAQTYQASGQYQAAILMLSE
ncbi:MAG: hypothetical protein VB957_00340 [Pseudomonadales bacterium]|jgi:uncharacterized lipoprotein YehR (DUF1307 family)